MSENSKHFVLQGLTEEEKKYMLCLLFLQLFLVHRNSQALKTEVVAHSHNMEESHTAGKRRTFVLFRDES
jgi:hypothetical protein